MPTPSQFQSRAHHSLPTHVIQSIPSSRTILTPFNSTGTATLKVLGLDHQALLDIPESLRQHLFDLLFYHAEHLSKIPT